MMMKTKEELIEEICGAVVCMKYVHTKESNNTMLDDAEKWLKILRERINCEMV